MQKENLNKTNTKVGLERFNKNKKTKRVIMGSIVGLIVLIGGITLYRTFALYEEKKEFNVLTGRVPYFIDYKGMLREVKVDSNEIPYEDYYAEKEHITRVVLENKIVPKETEKVYDVSVNKDGSVMAYLVANETDSTKYTLYLQADGKIKGNINSNYMFASLSNVESIEGIENIDLQYTTSLNNMFMYCSSLKELDLSSLDTSNITSMIGMFNGCSNLINLNLNGFDTRKVTVIAGMFRDCSSLTNLDLSIFDTRSVRDMSAMFFNCLNLKDINVTSFNTSQVVNMNGMFQECPKITQLDLSNFDTSNVTDMSNMFSSEVSNLKTIVYGTNFIRKEGADVSSMFYHCNANKPTHSSWDSAF